MRYPVWFLAVLLLITSLGCSAGKPPTPPPVPDPLIALAATSAFYACPYFTKVGDPGALKILGSLNDAFNFNPEIAITMLEDLGKAIPVNGAVAGIWSVINTVLSGTKTAAEWYAEYAPVAQAAVEGCIQGLTPPGA